MEDLTIVPMLRVGMPFWTLCVLFVFVALRVALCVVSAIAVKKRFLLGAVTTGKV
ncbi:hypothetical protein ALQ08_02754 [Pseudomonas syringae pv. delphinii]|uniref:Uncharacterized protein n=1 Tax=Pseudomonas syringae pv. delphinii TaxID=192088 RepID=A0A3M4BK67_9PSED|nr:hypothetical protein [Pseudomonas syringae group genomosp. 3]RMP19552.1 hypothetical protein ALQ28_03538 [Pseudomonas syringae pv. delphinii]RMQ25918.1 hypothetical protein ALQ08_02754 [Pseudomonas syringae pv. delphinii]